MIDAGFGNIGGLCNLADYLGKDYKCVKKPQEIDASGCIVLPGVGSFDFGVECLKGSGFWSYLKYDSLARKNQILGICLGMQLLFEGSEEGDYDGLGLLKGYAKKFNPSEGLPVPHMGWNTCDVVGDVKELFFSSEPSRYYFSHSFYVPSCNRSCVGKTWYGEEFASVVRGDGVLGFQFHPEKSHLCGSEALLRAFKLMDH